jgi:hypothetical protein
VDVFPFSIDALPDAGLSDCRRGWVAVVIDLLEEPHVADNGRVRAKRAHLRRGERCIADSLSTLNIEIELVEGHPLDAVAERLRLEAGQRWIAKLLIGRPVPFGDRVEELPSEIEKLGFDCRRQSRSPLIVDWREPPSRSRRLRLMDFEAICSRAALSPNP